jgi:dTDP-4-dehydrorhamnose reductase
MKKIIVTGASGFVAGGVVSQAVGGWEVHAVDRKEVSFARDGLFWHTFDLLDSARMRELFREVKPDAVVHAAAAADIDFCENNRAAVEAVNVGVTREIVRNCAEHGARLVYLSTDTVFDGKKGMYAEADKPAPVNFYGDTKFRAEQFVRAELPEAAIPRLSLVIGFPFVSGGNSFLASMAAALSQGKEYGVTDEEIRTPVDVVTLARAFLELAGNDFAGFIHLAGCDRMNRHAASLLIADRLGYPRELVIVKNVGSFPGRAPRPLDVSLDNSLARATLKTPMLGLAGALDLIAATKP